ncbi:hypothetical protein [Lachnoclostridium phytofermentans]|uniref:Peptidylprolyl isomerase n=1 Tax=Lachnoclostridium phytofermentans (strain ATCC 700394 / DSM 18823 / ISDg) TaxID=357809 RepID=A9KLB6_LACP7|nr:hypothetical protein [Lachnoclostridium phytofermentans]ABX41245.1 hypothetical protein Cphy_0859 [Lachnoclostridium phytofermentans ISDg]
MNHYKKLIVLLLSCLLFALSSCSKTISLTADSTVVSVGETTITLDEMMYHVLLAKMQGELYASFLGEKDFWTKEYEPSVTMADQMKQYALDNAIKYEILYEMAENKDYSLTEEELSVSEAQAEDIEKTIPEEELKSLGLTNELIEKIQRKISLSTKYYEDYLLTLSADEKEAKLRFEEKFEELKKEYQVKVNNSIWEKVDITNPSIPG